MPQAKPVIFLAFANDREGRVGYLRNLPEELRGVREVLEPGRAAGLWDVVERTNATIDDVLDVFQHPDYRDRIAIFHFGGHAGSYELLLELPDGKPGPIDAAGLAAFLGQQRGLQLAFLNGCSTGAQTQGLLDAGLSAVIATSRSIDDQVATTFASRFYRGLASGAGVQVAFDEAAAAVRMACGGLTRDVYREAAEDDEGWPWALRFRKGAEEAVGRWSLGEAAGNPLLGLPAVPRGDLPDRPYRHLQWFSREHAEVFFGRGHEIRELYERVTSAEAPPILLLYGQSGVGKSSLLDAGLLPRLEGSHEARYARRAGELGLLGTLRQALTAEAGGASLAEGWHRLEQASEKPVLVILDQVEEVFTRPDRSRPNELAELVASLVQIFGDPQQRPRGKLLLSFRKEWLAEVEGCLSEAKLPRAKVFLARLDRAGVIEAVSGPALVPRLRDHFGLTIEGGLPEIIADALLEDRESHIAPTLQILLTKMWDEAARKDASHPRFDGGLYHALKRDGILLKDFLDQQLGELRRRREGSNAASDTGLALDILHYHTTSLATAERRSADELAAAYGHVGGVTSQSLANARSAVPTNSAFGGLTSLVRDFKDLFLLVDDAGDRPGAAPATRLAHDTLAPLVRKEFDNSAQPGQLARRILENRVVEWKDGLAGAPLDERDLAVAEDGVLGMRAWTDDERRLIDASRKARAERQHGRRVLWASAILVWALVVLSAGYAWRQRGEAIQARLAAESRQFASAAMRVAGQDPLQALVLAIEAGRRSGTYEAQEVLRSTLEAPRVEAEFRHVIPPEWGFDGRLLLTEPPDSLTLKWAQHAGLGTTVLRLGVRDTIVGARFSVRGDLVVTTMPGRFARGPGDGTRSLPPLVPQPFDAIAMVWDARTGDTVAVLRGHKAVINDAAFSPDGSLLVTASADSTARVWNARTGEPVVVLKGHKAEVGHAAFAPDSRVVTASEDGTARVWETGIGREDTALRVTKPGLLVAISPDGQQVLTAGHDTARLGDTRTGVVGQVLTGVGDGGEPAFGPHGRRFAMLYGDSVRVWDLGPKSTSGPLVPSSLESGSGYAVGAAFRPDGESIVTVRGGVVQVWDVHRVFSRYDRTDKLVGVLPSGTTAAVVTASFSADGKHILAIAKDGTARVWGSEMAREISTTPPPGNYVGEREHQAVSPDGRYEFTAINGVALVRDLTTKDTVKIDPGNLVKHVAFSPDGGQVVVVRNLGEGEVWRMPNGEVTKLEGHTEPLTHVAFSPDGKLVVTASEDSTARIWDPQDTVQVRGLGMTGRTLMVLQGHSSMTDAGFSPDGRQVVTASMDGVARVWSARTGKVLAGLRGHSAPVVQAGFSPNGGLVLTASEDSTARLWDARTGHQIVVLRGSWEPLLKGRFSQDGRRIVTVGKSGTKREYFTALNDLLDYAESQLPVALTEEKRAQLLRP